MPEAICSDSYCFMEYNKKNIDVLQYGRRWEWLHKQILPFCRENDIHYTYPQENGDTKFRFKNRDELIDDLSRTKIAICVPRTITQPDIFDLSALTTRYFECMSSKCLILGHAPDDLIALYGYNPVVEVDYLQPLDQIRYLLDHFNDYVPLIERNYKITKERHQWKNRITDMRNIMNDHDERKGTARYM
jgi:spore maturation protein CgeB